jgi:hypothetical protein
VPVRGEAALRRELRRLEKKFPDAVDKALAEEALDLLAASQDEVPVDTGRLKNTGVVGAMRGRIGYIVAYGTDYALPVHERTEVRHTVGKAKYLEDPFNRAATGMTRRLVQRARRHIPEVK